MKKTSPELMSALKTLEEMPVSRIIPDKGEDWARVFTVDGKQALFQRYYDECEGEELPYKIKITSMLEFAKCEIRTDYPTEESRDAAWFDVATVENAGHAIQAGLNMFK